ncbi:MAG TPA: CpcT/CpeT family chromophore lyase [Steroidobacteraceae bacterium]|nr:CpcT/CpeT family chromophore lyase [Steroidobacteraceae bacterium]
MAEGVRAAGAGIAALIAGAALVLGGCASEPKASETDLLAMLTLLPGRYDNGAQAEADARNGTHPAHEAVTFIIIHVYTPRLGHYVYYAQESAADDPRRVLSQKMYGFQLDEKRGIVETVYEFVDPLRWRDGYQSKDLFTAVTTEDVQPEGCQLLWTKQGDGFVAAHDPKVCPGDGGAGAPPPMELTKGALTVGDYRFRKGR